jgi:hypothetical protein
MIKLYVNGELFLEFKDTEEILIDYPKGYTNVLQDFLQQVLQNTIQNIGINKHKYFEWKFDKEYLKRKEK